MVHSVTIVLRVYRIQTSYVQQLLAAIYSASTMDRVKEFCFFEDQETKGLPKKLASHKGTFSINFASGIISIQISKQLKMRPLRIP
jgi:hypothetical protein